MIERVTTGIFLLMVVNSANCLVDGDVKVTTYSSNWFVVQWSETLYAPYYTYIEEGHFVDPNITQANGTASLSPVYVDHITSGKGIKPNTVYAVKVFSNYGTNASATVTTNAATLFNLTQSISKPTSTILVSWGAVTGTTGYELFCLPSYGNFNHSVPLATSGIISGLTPGVEYTVQIAASYGDCCDGLVGSGNITTRPGPPVVTAKQSMRHPTDTIDVSWSSVTTATGYEVTWQPETAGSSVNPVNPGSKDTTATINGLKTGFKYVITVKVHSAGGISDGGNATVITKPGPPNATAQQSKTNPTNTIDVFWDPVTGATGYQVLFTPGAWAAYIDPSHLGANATRAKVCDLDPDTRYWMTVTVHHPGGTSDGTTVEANTAPFPEPPSSVTLNPSTIGDTSHILVSWKKEAGASGYRVNWTPADGVPQPIEITSTTVVIKDLHPSQTYNVEVRAAVGMVVSNPSSYTTTTAKSLPPPTLLMLNPSTAGTIAQIKVNWTRVAEATFYRVTWTPKDGMQQPIDVTNASTTITYLTPGQMYTVQVTAIKATAQSDPALNSTATDSAPPFNVLLTSSTKWVTSQIKVVWSPVALSTGYMVTWIPSHSDQPLNISNGTTTTTIITGLAPSKSYTVEIRTLVGAAISNPASKSVTTGVDGVFIGILVAVSSVLVGLTITIFICKRKSISYSSL